VHHRDISVANLMYYRLDGKVYGVLNDYDLSILPDQKRTLGTERTGTWPFMAVDMLLAPDNNPLHIYGQFMCRALVPLGLRWIQTMTLNRSFGVCCGRLIATWMAKCPRSWQTCSMDGRFATRSMLHATSAIT
jgi:hypothetical protein